jgi:hypothetical protein
MYFKDAPGEIEPSRSAGLTFTMALCAVVVLAMGIFPTTWLGFGG